MEKIIIKGKILSEGQRVVRCFVIPVIIFLIYLMIWVLNVDNTRLRYWGTGERKTSLGEYISESMHLGDCFEGAWWGLVLWISIICFVVGVIIYWAIRQVEIVVSDKRVYGKTAFGKQVDLPVDSISSIGVGAFGKIEVATSSGVIEFVGIKNKQEVHKAITELIMTRQNSKDTTSMNSIDNSSNIDELKKYKELYDSGVITQEEFDAKKKQLLGL